MDLETIKQRARDLDPQWADLALAVMLTVIVCGQIWLVTHVPPPQLVPPGRHSFVSRMDFGPLPYLVAAFAFMPLSMRRSLPWGALVLSGVGAALYQMQPYPPAFTVLAPMIAVYSLAAYSRRRVVALVGLGIAGLAIAVPAFAFSFGVRWVAETVGSLTLLIAATMLGDASRSRRAYIAEVEMRAAEAERTREEEALRRVDEERIRIAREVHDIVAHSLAIVTVQAAAAEATLTTDSDQALESVRNIRATGRSALAELRSMLDVLRTGDSEMQLTPAADLGHLEQLLAPVRDAGLTVNVDCRGDLTAIPAYASLSGYRIVQEALTNAVRHARATRVELRLSVDAEMLDIEVSDDGVGAPPTKLDDGGHGIEGMRERVDALGGSFEIGPAPTRGVRVRATIPLTRSGS